jgi:ribokinase
VQLRRLAGSVELFTSVGDDDLGRRAALELHDRHGIDVYAGLRQVPQRRAFTHLDAHGERTITVTGERHVPSRSDPLPWDRLRDCDAVFFTGGDAGALHAARAARVLVATPRAGRVLHEAGVKLDVLVASSRDVGEAIPPLPRKPRCVVLTAGDKGGTWTAADGTSGRWDAAAPPRDPVDAYGCGDSFAAGLTYGLGAGMSFDDAVALGAECGAACASGRGPYAGQLTLRGSAGGHVAADEGPPGSR